MSETEDLAVRVVRIGERGTTLVELTSAQASAVQRLGFCNVTPTGDATWWRVADVSRVGVAAIPGLRIEIVPKAPLRSIVFMASYGGGQLVLDHERFDYDADVALPSALAAALQIAVERAIGRGLLKGYHSTDDTSYVVRGRWDVARQLQRRPGLPLPLELTYDDFTEDILENRIIRSALRMVLRIETLDGALRQRLLAQLESFSEVGTLPVGMEAPHVVFTRRNAHYSAALAVSRWILEATSWAHEAGAERGSTFLVSMADIYERFVGEALRSAVQSLNVDVHLQVRDWALDVGGAVRLRPDIVLSRSGRTLTVADTKYKVWGRASGSPPNADVYQALAYAIAAGVEEGHLIYVSGDVVPRTYDIVSAGKRVVAHAVDIGGSPDELLTTVSRLAGQMLESGRMASP